VSGFRRRVAPLPPGFYELAPGVYVQDEASGHEALDWSAPSLVIPSGTHDMTGGVARYWYGFARAELRAARLSFMNADRAWHLRRAREGRELARYFRRLEALP
jgi:hypothetical protein